MLHSFILGVVLLSSNRWWEAFIRLVPIPSSHVLLLCQVVPLFPCIIQEICHVHLTRLVMLRNQLQHSLLKGFARNWHYRNTARVLGRSSGTCAFFLPLLHNLLLFSQLWAESRLGRWGSWLLVLLQDSTLLKVLHTQLHCLLLGTAIWPHTSGFLILVIWGLHLFLQLFRWWTHLFGPSMSSFRALLLLEGK